MQPSTDIDPAHEVLPNPGALPWVVGVGAAALAVGGIVLYARKAKAAAPKLAPASGKKPAPPKPTGKYAGTGWTDWPHKDRFPDLRSLAHALDALGYDVGDPSASGWNPRSPQAIQSVKDFQEDWNIIVNAYEPIDPVQFYQQLTRDGKLGTQTISALYWALRIQSGMGPWINLVAEADANGPVSNPDPEHQLLSPWLFFGGAAVVGLGAAIYYVRASRY